MVRDGIEAVGCGREAEQEDDQCDIAVHRLALQLGALAALGGAQLVRDLRLGFQILFCPAQHRQAVLGVFRQLRQLAGGLFGLLLLHGLLTCRAQPLDLRLLFGQNVQQGVHVPLILEVALLLLAAVVLHHQIGHGGEHPFAGKAALAHGDPLERAGDAAVRQIIAAVDVKAVEVQRLFADAAGADLFAGFFVCFQLGSAEFCQTQLCRFEQHSVSLFCVLFVPIVPLFFAKCKSLFHS